MLSWCRAQKNGSLARIHLVKSRKKLALDLASTIGWRKWRAAPFACSRVLDSLVWDVATRRAFDLTPVPHLIIKNRVRVVGGNPSQIAVTWG